MEDYNQLRACQHEAQVPRELGPGERSPIHDHGVQGGLSQLVGAPSKAHGAVALLPLGPALVRSAGPLPLVLNTWPFRNATEAGAGRRLGRAARPAGPRHGPRGGLRPFSPD